MKEVQAHDVGADTSADSSGLSEQTLNRKSYRGMRIWSRPDPKYLIRIGKHDEDEDKDKEKKKDDHSKDRPQTPPPSKPAPGDKTPKKKDGV
jgi:hypothetical protein